MSTMKDVAKLAGVSVGSVSNVINGLNVKESTYKKVMDAIDQLGYETNYLARGFKTNRTKMIGLILPTIWHPFFSEFAYYVEETLKKSGYSMLLCNSDGNADSEVEYIQMLRQNMIDGLIAITYSDIAMYLESNLPFVSIDRYFDNNINFVSSDNYQGGYLAAKTLIDKGANKLLFTGSHNRFVNATMDRRRGFEDYCLKHNIHYSIIDLMEPHNNYPEAVNKIFKEHPNIDGIFAINDFLAMDIIHELKIIGREVNRDYKIIGFDGIKLSHERNVIISTIKQSTARLAEEAVRILFATIEDSTYRENSIVPVSFIEGGTT